MVDSVTLGLLIPLIASVIANTFYIMKRIRKSSCCGSTVEFSETPQNTPQQQAMNPQNIQISVTPGQTQPHDEHPQKASPRGFPWVNIPPPPNYPPPN